MTNFLYKDITEKIIGAAFRVHSQLGNGFQEVIYQRALEYEFSRTGLNAAMNARVLKLSPRPSRKFSLAADSAF